MQVEHAKVVMGRMMSSWYVNLRFGAVVVGLLGFYVAPVIPIAILASTNVFGGGPRSVPLHASPVMFVLIWFLLLAPVGAGFLAAKLAKQQPLLHGVAVGVAAAVLVGLVSRAHLAWLVMLQPIVTISAAVFGAWFWRFRDAGRASAMRAE